MSQETGSDDEERRLIGEQRYASEREILDVERQTDEHVQRMAPEDEIRDAERDTSGGPPPSTPEDGRSKGTPSRDD